ncbi:MAG: hypothetical protein JJE13_03550 [Thermoleophilia bacterium]|nr:hypothetical protein [Thermoleophilia bacterium]
MADQPRKSNRRKTRPGENGARPQAGADSMSAGYAKAEAKNEKVRESLEPLKDGERPTVVTVGAVFAIVVALILWGSTVVALVTDAKVNGEDVNIAQWVGLATIFSVMAWGMWTARYWAVLGFQMLLVLLILAAILGLVVAGTLVQMISTSILLIGLSLLFYYMVKAMARIQMPESPKRR